MLKDHEIKSNIMRPISTLELGYIHDDYDHMFVELAIYLESTPHKSPMIDTFFAQIKPTKAFFERLYDFDDPIEQPLYNALAMFQDDLHDEDMRATIKTILKVVDAELEEEAE